MKLTETEKTKLNSLIDTYIGVSNKIDKKLRNDAVSYESKLVLLKALNEAVDSTYKNWIWRQEGE